MPCDRKALCCILVLCIVLCVQMSLASLEFRVGGPSGWVVPTGNDVDTYNEWAERNRFQVNDNLYFKYQKVEDSVLVVTEEAYKTCNTLNPIAFYNDGNTVIMLRHSGPFFFISGAPGNCEKGQKLIVVVLASSGNAGPVSSSPSPSPFHPGMGNRNSSSILPSTAPTSIAFASLYFTALAAVTGLPYLIILYV